MIANRDMKRVHMKDTPKIAWEKWQNPYKPIRTEDYEEADFVQNANDILLTSQGLVPMTEGNDPEKVHNFWIINTNFPITYPMVNIMQFTPGIESMDLYSQYRLRVGIGKLFDSFNVRQEFNKRVKSFIEILNDSDESPKIEDN
jgi:hypothetical protein